MSSEPGSLLVADDDQLSRDMFSQKLKNRGFQVAVSPSGEHAIDWINQNSVDLLLLDVEMSGISGFDVLRILRENYSQALLPIIMVTGRTGTFDIVQALNMGANDYVTKPIDFPVALARIETQLYRKLAEEALRQSEERYALAALGANDGLWDWDLKSNKVYYSPRWKSMLGYEEKEIGDSFDEWIRRVHPEDSERLLLELTAHLEKATNHYEHEFRMLHRDGDYRWMLGRGLAVRDREGKAYRMAGSLTDITRGKVADILTGLPNRVLFMDRLGRSMKRMKRHEGYGFAIIYMDLDSFKLVNDSLGHVVGDQLLIAVATRLESSLRSTDTVSRFRGTHTLARMGGDEFTILLDDIRDPADAMRVAERLAADLARPFTLAGQTIFTTASMGIATSSMRYSQPEDFLRDADTAMYRAKTQGKSRCEIFDAGMRASALARLQLETELRNAVEHREFVNYYQIIVDLKSGLISGAETLVRWQHPSRGLVAPGEFIPVAEETGLILPIGEFVLQDGCRQMSNWSARFSNRPPMYIAVNMSAKNFAQASLLDQCKHLLEETGLSASCLALEITESAIMSDLPIATATMARLKSHNVKIVLDDFGTGYSALSYLRKLPLDIIKIDRSFVAKIENARDTEDSEIVKTVISLAHNLGLVVVAEGIETAIQLFKLREWGADYGQGYYFSVPLDAQGATDLLAANRRW